jgi:arylsulfatase A-like enzyme
VSQIPLRIALLIRCCLALATATPERPNILFIFTDDQAFDTIAAAGAADLSTPSLDRLTRRGTTFTRAYNMGSWTPAVCVASRTMLISGRSLWRAHEVSSTLEKEQKAGRLWPQLMAQAGYRTHFTGKWHVPIDATQLFHETKNIRGGMPKDVAAGYNRPHPDGTDPWDPSDARFGGFWQGGTHWSEVLADDTIDFIQNAADAGQPFFIYAAFNAPHDPRQSPQEFIDRYPLDRVSLPPGFLPEYPHMKSIGAGPSLRDEKLAPFPRTPHAIKVHRQEYYALITHMDAQIGRILDSLDRAGETDRTWIFFTSDHGLAVGRHGLMGKQNMYEHSLRVPFIVAGPGVAAGKSIDSPIYLQDVMATALDLARAEKPDHVEFHSLLPLLEGKTSPAARETLYAAYLRLQRAVIEDGWKLISYPEAGVVRLYHLTQDPDELNDLAADPAQAQRITHLSERLRAMQQDLADPLPSHPPAP